MVDDARHVKGRLHAEVISAPTAYLNVVRHDAQLRLPVVNPEPAGGVGQPHPYVAHGVCGRVCPIAVACYHRQHAAAAAHVSVGAVFGEQRPQLIGPLPVGHVGAQQAPQVAAFVDKYLGLQPGLAQAVVKAAHHPGHLAVGCRRAFLLGAEPVPVSVGLVQRRYVVDGHAVVSLKALDGRGDERGKVVVTVAAEVQCAAPAGVGGQLVLREIYRRRVEEGQNMRHAALACQPQEVAFGLLLGRIELAVGLYHALGARRRLYHRGLALLFAARPYVESPQAQPYALGLSGLVAVGREEPVGHLPLLSLGPPAHILHAPCVGSAEVQHRLPGLVGLYCVGGPAAAGSAWHGGKQGKCRCCDGFCCHLWFVLSFVVGVYPWP